MNFCLINSPFKFEYDYSCSSESFLTVQILTRKCCVSIKNLNEIIRRI